MAHWKHLRTLVALGIVLSIATCSKKPSVSSPTGPSSVGAPTISSPSDDEQLDTLTPTLVVNNVTSVSGAKTYDFQVSENVNFSPVVASKLSVPEGSGGTTSATISTTLTPSTRFYWRARVVQNAAASDWVIGKFRSKAGSYSRAGELYDMLTDGYTVGERFGTTTFVPGEGLRLDTQESYVRYQLPATVSTGEFSMEVKGLYPNGPDHKMAIFSMAQGTGSVTGNAYEMYAQYRGLEGNPPNAISFKAVWGDLEHVLEFQKPQREASIFSLDPSTIYFWQGRWTATSFRLTVKRGGMNGTTIYDKTLTASGGSYAPNPHVAYLGSNSGADGTNAGSWPGLVIRNVWLGTNARPASLGSERGPGR